MRFYPTADVSHYWEFPSAWSLYSRTPHERWQRRPVQAKHTIAYWRDIEGAKMPTVNIKDLYFKDWPQGRVRAEACLPLYYGVGNRFIRLEKAFPIDYKCAVVPMNLQEVRAVNEHDKTVAKNVRANAKEAKKLAIEKAKLEMKKKGIRK